MPKLCATPVVALLLLAVAPKRIPCASTESPFSFLKFCIFLDIVLGEEAYRPRSPRPMHRDSKLWCPLS